MSHIDTPRHTGSSEVPVQASRSVPAEEASFGTLVSQLSEQVPELIRSEMRLAQAEIAQKGKRAGLGIGMFSAAGLLAFFGLTGLLATVTLALALVLPAWAAALTVTVLLFTAAAVSALMGKKQVTQATPPVPERAVQGVKDDIDTLKGKHA